MHKYSKITISIWIILGLIALMPNNLKAQIISADYQSFDGQNVLLFGCDYQEPVNRMYINILNVSGGSGNYTVTTAGDCSVSSSTITAGEGFTFYFTEPDQIAGIIDFTISDSAGNTYNLDPLIKTQIELLQFFICNSPNYTCRNNVEHIDLTVPVTEFNTSNYIKSSGTILSPSVNTSYLSGNYVELQAGFEVPQKAGFFADIQNCNP